MTVEAQRKRSVDWDGWRAWGEKFGWGIESADADGAEFNAQRQDLPRSRVDISNLARATIDAVMAAAVEDAIQKTEERLRPFDRRQGG